MAYFGDESLLDKRRVPLNMLTQTGAPAVTALGAPGPAASMPTPTAPAAPAGGAMPLAPATPTPAPASAPRPASSFGEMTTGMGMNQRPMVLPPLPTPGGGAEPISDFGPGNDLRFSQINPADDSRTTKLSSLVDAAADKVGNAPSLTQAGLDKLAELRQSTLEDRRAGMQNIGRAAAQFGRIGSGVTTGQLGDLESLLQARQLASEKGLAGDLAMQEGTDRRANAGVLASLQDQMFGQGSQRRNELRSERGYQSGVANDSYSRDVQNRLLEEELRDRQFGRNVTAAQLGLEGAGQYDQSASDSAAGAADLVGTMAMLNARTLGTAPASATTPTRYTRRGDRVVPLGGAQ